MPITIVPEDGIPSSLPLERCCFCRVRTNMWAPSKDVACCTTCAETHEEKDLPTKAEWCDKEEALTPRIGGPRIELENITKKKGASSS